MTEDIMPDKPEEEHESWRKKNSRYFDYSMSVQSLKAIKVMLKQISADLMGSQDLAILDAGVTQQSVLALIILHAYHTLEEKGAKRLERELAPYVEELAVMVAEGMRERGKDLDPKYYPEGFSWTKGDLSEHASDFDPRLNPPQGWY